VPACEESPAIRVAVVRKTASATDRFHYHLDTVRDHNILDTERWQKKHVKVRSINDLAAVVRGRRRDLGLSQAELAVRAGVSRKWIYQFEAGKPTAELRLILRVLEALGLILDVTYDEQAPGGRQTRDLDTLIDEHRE
jgi:HTH-type transcriptional regulator/antitoxin HipB